MAGESARISLLAAALAWPGLAIGQPSASGPPASGPPTDVLVVPRLRAPIDLDGRVDEAAWDAVAPLPLVTHWPEFGGAPSEPTEIRVAHDDDYLYVSCRCYASPEAVFAASFQRDLWSLATDYLAIALDTFRDRENAAYFLVSPTGSRTDVAIADDANSDPDPSWNTFWDVEATVTEAGWFAEVRIPFSSLRYRVVDGRVEMGMSTFRYLGRKNEMDVYPAIPPDWGFFSNVKPSQMQPVRFEGVGSGRPVYVTPYALGGLGQEFALDDAEAAYVRTDDPVTELGADLKMGLTDNLTLDLTLNTDFAQVEADDPQVNLTRFSLFFPEKRQFFLERASVFDVGFGGPDRLFYSRRIGLRDGEAVRLLGGGRVVGRVGDWDVGLLDLQTARRTIGPEERLPSENFGVVRLQRQAFNTLSTVGGIVTSRLGDDGAYNVAYGLDGDVNLFGDSFLALNWAQTFDDADPNDASMLDLARFRAEVERRAFTGTSYALGVSRAGRAYRPDLGFQLREDYTAVEGRLSQGWGPAPGSPFSRHQMVASLASFFRNADGSAETVEGSVGWDGQATSGAFFGLRLDATRDDVPDGFDLSDDVAVPSGTYTFVSGNGFYQTARAGALAADVNAGVGTFYDGWRLTAGVSPQWVASKHLALSGGYEVNQISFPDRNQRFLAHVGTVRVQAALDTKWSLASFLQINSAADAGLANVRLRYNPREGTDLYLVVNEGFNTDRRRAAPAQPFTSGRAVLAKYTTTFTL